MPDAPTSSPASTPQSVRLSLDALLKIASSYAEASAEALCVTPDDRNLHAFSVFVENSHFYLKQLKTQIESLEKIQDIISTYKLRTTPTDSIRQ